MRHRIYREGVGFRLNLTAKRTLIFLLVIIASQLMPGCAESMFDLAPDSRLPRWFALPKGLTRAEVTVHETKYLDHSVFTLYDTSHSSLWDSRGHELAQVSAVSHGAISLSENENAHGGYDGNPYPLYEVLTVNGITEVLEYKRMEPLFYVSDDPQVRKRLDLPNTSH